MTPNEGTVLDNQFELVKLVGEGGMGRVFRSRDLRTGSEIAIKTLLPQLLSDPTAAEELRREVKVGQRVVHPGIVALHEYRVWQRVPFIVMEFVEGRPLNYFQFEQAGRRLSEVTFRAFADQMLDAVGFAHGMGVVHRDLKPGNIMVQPDARLKLMDFGIAATLKATFTRLTGRGSAITIQYASPEQINGDDPSPSMDIYSCGCMFYEMLTGRPPFYQGEILHQHLTKLPARIQGVSPSLNDAVLACLEKDPAKRPHSALEVRGLLSEGRTIRVGRRPAATPTKPPAERLHARHSETQSPTALEHTTDVSFDTPSRLPLFLIGAAVLLTLVVVAVWSSGGAAVLRPRKEPTPAASVPEPVSTPSRILPTTTAGPPPTATPADQPVVPAGRQPVNEPLRIGASSDEMRRLVQRELDIGNAAHERGDYQAARAAFRRAIALNPASGAARAGLVKADRAEQAEISVGVKR